MQQPGYGEPMPPNFSGGPNYGGGGGAGGPMPPNYSGMPPSYPGGPGGGPPQPNPYMQPRVYTNNTIEADAFLGGTSSFSDIKIRHAFIRKVYSIITVQLLITIAIGSVIMFVDGVNKFFYTNSWLLWLFIFGTPNH